MIPRKISRRDFLKSLGIASAGMVVAACAPKATQTEAPKPAGEKPTEAPKPGEPTQAPKPTATPQPTMAPPPAEKFNLTLWGWWDQRMQIFQDAANDYTKDNPNITVKVESIPFDDLWPKVYAAVPAGTGPHMLKNEPSNYFKMRDLGILAKYDEAIFPKSWFKEKYPVTSWDFYETYVVPEGGLPTILTYNKKLFTEAGLDPEKPPTTWDGLVDAALKTTKRDSTGLIIQEGFAPEDWTPQLALIYQLGGNVVKKEADKLVATFNTPEMEKVMTYLTDMVVKHKVWDTQFLYYEEAMGTGKLATSFGEAWTYGDYKTTYADVFPDLGFAPLPTPSGEPDPYWGRVKTVLSLTVIKEHPTDEIVASFKYVDYLYNQRLDSQLALAQMSGLAPIRKELMEDPKVTGDPFTSLLLKVLAKEYDAGELTTAFNQLTMDALNKVFLEKATVQQAMEFGQTELQKLFDTGDTKYLR